MEDFSLDSPLRFRACTFPDICLIEEFDRLVMANLQSKNGDNDFVFTFNNVFDGDINPNHHNMRHNTISIHRGTPVELKVGSSTATVFCNSTLFIKDEDSSEEIIRVGTIIPYATGSLDGRCIAFINKELFDSNLKRKTIGFKRFLIDIICHCSFFLKIEASINTIYVTGNISEEGIEHYYNNVSNELSACEYLTTEDKSSQLFKLSSKKV